LDCQRATCEALAAFLRLTFNASNPWQHDETWNVTRSRPCSAIVPRGAGAAPPAYCRWYGIACCDPAGLAAGACRAVHSVAVINITADSLNGSYSDPPLMDALELLHACGMVGLNLESNDMSGELGPRWGRFTNLRTLNLGARR
jgi:hypothetical protein